MGITVFYLRCLCGSAGKESACNAGDLGSIPGLRRPPSPGLGRSPGGGTHPIFLPGEFHGLYCPWGCKESDTTEWLLVSLSPEMSNESNVRVIIDDSQKKNHPANTRKSIRNKQHFYNSSICHLSKQHESAACPSLCVKIRYFCFCKHAVLLLDEKQMRKTLTIACIHNTWNGCYLLVS